MTTEPRRLTDSRGVQYSTLWTRMTIDVGLAVARIDGSWVAYTTMTPEVRQKATAVYMGGYENKVSEPELWELVRDGLVTPEVYLEVVGYPYSGPLSGGPRVITTEDGAPLTTEDGHTLTTE